MINSFCPYQGMNPGFHQAYGGFGGCGGSYQLMQMMQMMMRIMGMMMGGMPGGCGPMGGSPMGGSPMNSPNFGGGVGGGMPFNDFLGGAGGWYQGDGSGNSGYCSSGGGGGHNGGGYTGGGYNGGGYNGGAYTGGNGYNPGPYNPSDRYVPSGAGQAGAAPNITGTGQGADAVRWALGMEGISEANNPGAVRSISRGAWQPWCADFVSQAYRNSGGSPFGHQSSVAGILSWGRQNDRFFSAGQAAQNPGNLRVGDVAVWKQDGRSHVGLVTGVNQDGTFNTIEGNTGDAVRRRTHSFEGRGLTGFVRPTGSMTGPGNTTTTRASTTPAAGSSNGPTSSAAGGAKSTSSSSASRSSSSSSGSKSSSSKS